MSIAPITRRSTLGEVYRHPMGRDVMDKILLATGRSRWWLDNPLARRLQLRHLEKLGGRFLAPGLVDAALGVLNEVREAPSDGDGVVRPAWWKEAVFYQVYPRSFADSDGDGIGDLRGIINHLDHLDRLGVDCVWLSPVFASPNQDFGYDVSDYRAVMAEMGTMEDLDELVAACHDRGMRLILDLVVNHTSDQHEWFTDFLANPDGEHRDYYIVRQGDSAPNNWNSFFSGSAWRALPEVEGQVLHTFAGGQLDLNWTNPQVRAEVADIVQFWLARGVDGFRLDVINFVGKRDGLPDGNEFIGNLMMGFTGVEHYFHDHKLHGYLAELRREGFTRKDVAPGTEEPGGDAHAVMIGETPGIGMEVGRLLTGEDREELDLIFNFDVLESPGHIRWDDYRFDFEHLKRHHIEYQRRLGSGDWVSIFWDNHDNPRMLSKIDPDAAFRDPLARALAVIHLMLRGTPFLYQGQEIAAINQDFPDARALRDVESINRIAELEADGKDGLAGVLPGSRDHARTPMRWTRGQHHGFTTGEPWIGFHENSVGYTVEEQESDPGSALHHYRELIALRRQHQALRLGDITFVEENRKGYFGWFRTLDEERFFIEVNLTDQPLTRPLPTLECQVLIGPETPRNQAMEPYEARVCRLP